MIKVVKVQNNDYTEALERTIEVLDSNGVVVIPTDTTYGIAARVDSDEALKKVIDIKRRSPDKGLSMIVKDFQHAMEYAECDDRIQRFFEALFPGPYTLLLSAQDSASDLLTGRYRTVAVRIPNNEFTKDELLQVIRELPEGYRLVFNLYAIEGYKHQEIAELINISVTTSKSQLSRAKKLIKKRLKSISIAKTIA